MNTQKPIRLFMALVLSLLVIWSIAAAQVVEASSRLKDGKLASNEVIDNDVFAQGQEITIDGTINGDVFILGNQVQVNGTINGSLFAIGQVVVLQGKVSGTTYTAAVGLEVMPEAVLEQNLYFVGASLTTSPGSTIGRDLRTICLSADLKGSIGRDTRATIGLLKLITLIVNRLGGELPFPQSSLPPAEAAYLGAGGSLLAAPLAYLIQEPPATGSIDTARLTAWLLDRLREFGVLLLLGAIFYWLFRDPLYRTTRMLRLRPLQALGIGLLGLLIVVNLFLVGLLVASLVFVAGLWLGSLDLWAITLALWALAYGALVFILATLWVVVAYGTKLIVAYLAGTWLFEKITPKANVPHFLAFAVGILIYVLLRSIPMLGWALSVLVVAWGLGAIWLAYRKIDVSAPAEPLA
jgi:cytoskeletal protein CcmA (bactofilin family)